MAKRKPDPPEPDAAGFDDAPPAPGEDLRSDSRFPSVPPPPDALSYDVIRQRAQPRVRETLMAFDFAHLPPELAAISKPFCDLAHLHAAVLGGTQLEHGLQRLLEAKDCIVRAALSV